MSTFDDEVAIRTLIGECRGEPAEGQLAIAHVLINRLHDGRFGKTIAQVCLQHAQFSCWLTTDPNWGLITSVTEAAFIYQELDKVWLEAKTTLDPTNGALFYFADSMEHAPLWAAHMKVTTKIGHHTFMTDR